jgi:uncharacterized protein (TIGR00369 family)
MSEPTERAPIESGRLVSEYFRLERWEIPPPPGSDQPSAFGGRAPVDDHQRGAGGGLRTGGLLSTVDSLGGFLSGLSVQPEWIVTTSMMATISRLDHRGPLRLHGQVLRRGRKSVVSGVQVVDEGNGGRPVAVATVTCAVQAPGDMALEFERPVVIPMPPLPPAVQRPEADHLRNPWGILHGGAAAMLADVAACRAVAPSSEGKVAAGDMVLHYLRPVKAGPVEARCRVVGTQGGRTVVRVAVHDVARDDRLVTLASVAVLDV